MIVLPDILVKEVDPPVTLDHIGLDVRIPTDPDFGRLRMEVK